MVQPRRVIFANTLYAHCLPSTAEMAGFDAKTIASGVAAIDVMEKAGERAAALICELYQAKHGPQHPVTVLCGPGNNGGDGLVIARHLRAAGRHVAVVTTAAARYSPELTQQVSKYVSLGEEFFMFSEDARGLDQPGRLLDLDTLTNLLKTSWMVIDALLGAGQKDAPRGVIKTVIECLTEVRRQKGRALKCIALDIPSGVNGDSGQIFEPHVEADLTICIELVKRGLLQCPAREVCGDIRAVPVDIDCSEGTEFAAIARGEGVLRLGLRRAAAHKGDFGRVLVIGGSDNMPGAPVLSALGALRVGAGVVIKVEHCAAATPPAYAPELIYHRLGQGLTVEAVPGLVKIMQEAECTLLGPGLGTAAVTAKAVEELLRAIEQGNLPAVIDADALNILSEFLAQGAAIKLPSAIVTPHPGEMARLLGLSGAADVQQDRYAAARALAQRLEAVVALKGAASIVYSGSRGFVNLTGNPFMASAGSGDVLSGMIAGLVAQGKSLPEAAIAGVYYHGMAGDQAQQKNRGPIIASDIVAAIPGALASGML